TGVVHVDARTQLKAAAPIVGPVAVAEGITVDARLRRRREAVADRAMRIPYPPLEEAPLGRRAARDEEQVAPDRDRVALRVTRRPGSAVGRPEVALLGALDDAVPAPLDPARARATIARPGVAVVARLGDLELAVPTDAADATLRQGRHDRRHRRRLYDAGENRRLRGRPVLDVVRGPGAQRPRHGELPARL